MQNNIIERLNRKLCLIYLRNIYGASCIGFMCMDERIMLTVRIEKNYYMSYVGTGNLNIITHYNDIDIYELCGIIIYNERLNI